MPEILSPRDILNKIRTQPITASIPSDIPSPNEVLSQTQTEKKGFFSRLAGFGKKITGAVARKTREFVGRQAETVRDVSAGKLEFTPSDILEGIKDTAAGIGKGVNLIAEGFNEGVIRFVKSASEDVLGQERTERLGKIPIVSKFSQAAIGRERVASFQEIRRRTRDFAIKNEATDKEADIFSGIVVVGAMFVDNPFIGPGKNVFKIPAKAMREVAEETSDDAIKAILKRENKFLTNTELEALTPVFKNANTEQQVKSIADDIIKIQKTAPLQTAINEKRFSPDEILKRSEVERAPTRVADDITPELQPLAEEARKFKTAEEFVKPLQSARKADLLNEFDRGRAGVIFESTCVDCKGGATFVNEQLDRAVKLSKSSKPVKDLIAEGEHIDKRFLQDWEFFINEDYIIGRESAIERFWKIDKGFLDDAPDSINLVQKEGFETLTDFFNKVKRVEAPAPARLGRLNLIKAISEENIPGPIKDRLQIEFPNLSESALLPISKRLSRLKRTGDIEGILDTVRKIENDVKAFRATGKAPAPKKPGKPVGDLSPSVSEVLAPNEKDTYLTNISEILKDKERAVLAQREYDALWDGADQKVIDTFEELKIEKHIFQEELQRTPASGLIKFYGRTNPETTTLEEVFRSAAGTGKKASQLDEIITELGFKGFDDAQKSIDKYLALRKKTAELADSIRETGPQARAARLLQEMVEDVPVIAKKEAGEIESLAGPQTVRRYKDLTGFTFQSRDLWRNFRDVFGDRFAQAKDVMLDPLSKSKGDMVDEIIKKADDLEKNLTGKFKIKRGSKESEWIQRFGDTGLPGGERRTFNQLVDEFGPKRADELVRAEEFFRKTYDRLLDEINVIKAEIYPNNPSKLIPKRKDYFRHFQELGEDFRSFIDLFETPAGIDPQLAGISEFTKPKSKFLSFAQKRTGKITDIDAVGGFLNYVPSFAYAKHIDPHIGKFRYLRKRLADVAPQPGAVIDGRPEKGINNFLEYLDDFANDLAGKTNPMDRYLQKIIPGGRKVFRTIDWINKRVKANIILGNAASSIAQIFNVPQAIASAKRYSIPGLRRTLADVFLENPAMAKSAFLKERYQISLGNRFKTDWINKPLKAGTERAKEWAAWMTQALDEVGTRFAWNAHYSKAIAEGTPDPIQWADDVTRSLVAGRGVGEVPIAQKSKIFQLLAPFQLEVANAWRVQGDFLKRKDYAALTIFFITSYLMNQAAEKTRGTPVIFDPIDSLIDGSQLLLEELDEGGDPGRASLKFIGRQAGEVLSNVPLGQTIANAIPESMVQSITQKTTGAPIKKKEIFGTADPGRFGPGLVSIKGFSDPLYKLIPPFGGNQIKKTKRGLEAMFKGEVTDRRGKKSFDVEFNSTNLIRSILFGQNATPEAKEYYDERDDLFSRINAQSANRTELRLKAEEKWSEFKEEIEGKSREEKIQIMQAFEEEDPVLSDEIKKLAAEEQDGLNGVDRLIKMLGVENGERAKYIVSIVGDLKNKEDKILFLRDLDEKGLISDTVFEQIQFILSKEKAGQ